MAFTQRNNFFILFFSVHFTFYSDVKKPNIMGFLVKLG